MVWKKKGGGERGQKKEEKQRKTKGKKRGKRKGKRCQDGRTQTERGQNNATTHLSWMEGVQGIELYNCNSNHILQNSSKDLHRQRRSCFKSIVKLIEKLRASCA